MRAGNSSVAGEFEHARYLFLFPGKDRAFTTFAADAERGRIETPDGTSRRYSGPPPRDLCERLPPPDGGDSAREFRAALEDLIQPWRGRLLLHYSSLRSHRRTIGSTLSSPLRAKASWAVTGSLAPVRRGPELPLGWSGQGSGLAWLRSQAPGELALLGAAFDRAVPTETEVTEAVLAPPAAAVVLHEAVGHFAEASADSRIDLHHRLGCRLASDVLSLADDPLAAEGPAHYEYDDENVRCLGATPIVQSGVLVGQLHSQATARAAKTLPTANGRSTSAWDPAIPRVSNLLCEAGTAEEEDLIARVGRGLYVWRLANGVNNSMRIEARISLAERIAGGARTGRFVTGGRIEENPGLLLRTLEVANNPEFYGNAMCGRAGQLLFDVGTRAPSLRLSALRVTA